MFFLETLYQLENNTYQISSSMNENHYKPTPLEYVSTFGQEFLSININFQFQFNIYSFGVTHNLS